MGELEPVHISDIPEDFKTIRITVTDEGEAAVFLATDRVALMTLKKRWRLRIHDLGPFLGLTRM